MLVTVQELGTSKGGKPKCKANNVWYFLPTDRDTGQGAIPVIGSVIEIDPSSFTMGDKTFASIERWRPANQPQQVAHVQQAQQPQQAKAAPVDTSQAFIGQGFISNVVGQAIVAGIIKEPGQILSWFNAAKAALENKPAPQPFDDRIPYGDEDTRQAASSGRW